MNANAMPLRFTAEDADRAYEAWGANCGPGALAAVLGLSLEEVRPALGDFERKGFMNLTMMKTALDALGAGWRLTYPRGLAWPADGLAFVQWHGPWTAPGAPVRAAYRHTHWVGARRTGETTEVFDVNVLVEGGWLSGDVWSSDVVPWLLKDEPKATGTWHLRQAIEIDERPFCARGAHDKGTQCHG